MAESKENLFAEQILLYLQGSRQGPLLSLYFFFKIRKAKKWKIYWWKIKIGSVDSPKNNLLSKFHWSFQLNLMNTYSSIIIYPQSSFYLPKKNICSLFYYYNVSLTIFFFFHKILALGVFLLNILETNSGKLTAITYSALFLLLFIRYNCLVQNKLI